MPRRVKVIGLTGGIGSGKTTVAAMLAELGGAVIHADAVGHEIYSPNSDGWRRVTEAFGPDILNRDQSIDRQKLGAIVFGDAAALKRLNAIVHPLMFEEIRRRIEALQKAGRHPAIVVEAAVLIEANWLPLVDEVWVVEASAPDVMQRLGAERGLSSEAVATRLKAQLTNAERRPFAHVIIENGGSVDALRELVQAAWTRAIAS